MSFNQFMGLMEFKYPRSQWPNGPLAPYASADARMFVSAVNAQFAGKQKPDGICRVDVGLSALGQCTVVEMTAVQGSAFGGQALGSFGALADPVCGIAAQACDRVARELCFCCNTSRARAAALGLTATETERVKAFTFICVVVSSQPILDQLFVESEKNSKADVKDLDFQMRAKVWSLLDAESKAAGAAALDTERKRAEIRKLQDDLAAKYTAHPGKYGWGYGKKLALALALG